MAASLSLAGPARVVYEGSRAEFTLTLSEPTRTAERVIVTTAPGTATYGTDYFAPASTQILFAPGQTTARFAMSILSEGVSRTEGIETFQVIATPANRALGTRSVTVLIDDTLPPPQVSVGDVTVTEGNSGTTPATFQITLSARYNRPVTVNYATRDVTATAADNDYTPVNGALTFAPGETSKTVSVNVNGDRKAERDETFSLVLAPPAYGTIKRGTGTATIRNDETDQLGFQITMEYDPSVPNNIKSYFDAAAARWSRVIIGDLPGVEINGRFIDDILIRADVQTLADPLIIAQAGFSDIRVGNSGTAANGNFSQNGLPYIGAMTINSSFVTAPGIGNTIAHEMGHVLGFGTLWANSVGTLGSLVTGITTANPRFRGENAVRAYNEVFGGNATSVPLFEQSERTPPGYDGSYGSHWRDSEFNQTGPGVQASNQFFELMTAQYNVRVSLPNGQPIPSYLSKITVGAMRDLGYLVNPAAADPYTRPAATVAANVAAATASSPSPTPASALPKPIVKSPAVAPQPTTATSVLLLSQPTQPATAKPMVAAVNRAPSKPPQALSPPSKLAFAMLAKG
jgi:hypothetical protein